MDCEYFEELMSAALDGELSQDEQQKLDAHLSGCSHCAALFEALSGQSAALRSLDCPFPDGLHQRILDGLPPQKTAPVLSFPWRRWGALAACAVLVIGAVLAWPLLSGLSSGSTADGANANTMEDTGLADGSDLCKVGPEEEDDLAGAFYSVEGAALYADEPVPEAVIERKASPYSAEPECCSFRNDQYLRVTYGHTPAPSAQIIGSVSTLTDFLAQFPEDDLSAVAVSYDEEYFQANQLLAVTLEEPSGSITHQIAPDGLTSNQVTILRWEAEDLTDDMAAWLILAETDDFFQDGEILSLSAVPYEP